MKIGATLECLIQQNVVVCSSVRKSVMALMWQQNVGIVRHETLLLDWICTTMAGLTST